jgi:hypothetical protein
LLGTVAAGVLGLWGLVLPALPHAAGALALAGLAPSYSARLADPNTVVITQREPETTAAPAALSRRLWHYLATAESLPLGVPADSSAGVHVDWPNGVSGNDVLCRDIEPDADARPVLQQVYRGALRSATPLTRARVAARTVLEATWALEGAIEHPTVGTWEFFSGLQTLEGRWLWGRRAAKGVLALLVLWAALVLFCGRRSRPRHLLGALLMTASGVLLASELGPVTFLVWLAPLIVSIWALHDPNEPPTVPRAAVRPTLTSFEVPPLVQPPLPRITLEPEPPRTSP